MEMDTYYFTLSRYLDAFEWYSENLPAKQLGVTIANKDVNNLTRPDEYIARAHAWHGSPSLEWINAFDMPVDDEWREALWRWKTRCEGCQEMACFEMGQPCNRTANPRHLPAVPWLLR